jgi:triosephosphate isomerase
MDFFRKMIVAANWKMNTSITEGQKLLEDIMSGLPSDLTCQVIVAPPFTHLQMAIRNIGDKKISVAAQNCHYETSGAFTGEISAGMIKSLGAGYVIVGHSERRHLFHETSEILKKKVDAVLAAGLKPIFCCGEPQDIRESETHNAYVRMQLEQSIFHLDVEAFKNIYIAYEPIWAIGTGMTATPEQAQEMHCYIRDQIAIHYNKIVSEETHILYGGSIKADNARDIFTQSDVDGGLVGGASLNARGFLEIINAACG